MLAAARHRACQFPSIQKGAFQERYFAFTCRWRQVAGPPARTHSAARKRGSSRRLLTVSVSVVVALAGNRPSADVPATSDILAFAETELERALEIIVERRPRLIMIEKVFATTTRGAELIDRIKDDAALQPCEVRIVAFGEPPNPEPLDMSGTRRAPRFVMASGIEVDLDGRIATLVNMSLVGAQVLSPTIVKPKQRLRFTVIDQGRGIRIQSVVASVAVEIVGGSPRYRAGIEFLNADPLALQKYIDSNKSR
jgi:PilZ domain